jgi:hypothetical protein
MDKNEISAQLMDKLNLLEAKISVIDAKLNELDIKLNQITVLLSGNLVKNISKDDIMGTNTALYGDKMALLQNEIRKQENLDFRENVPSQLTKILYFIYERQRASATDIQISFNLGQPTYRRYIGFLRKWKWIELTPGAKRGNFVLSQTGKELLDRFLL